MPRVKRGFKARRRRNRVLKQAKGFFGSRHRLYRVAKVAVMHAWRDAYIGRRLRKRDMRRLWITRIGAAARGTGTSYSKLMGGLEAQLGRSVPVVDLFRLPTLAALAAHLEQAPTSPAAAVANGAEHRAEKRRVMMAGRERRRPGGDQR